MVIMSLAAGTHTFQPQYRTPSTATGMQLYLNEASDCRSVHDFSSPFCAWPTAFSANGDDWMSRSCHVIQLADGASIIVNLQPTGAWTGSSVNNVWNVVDGMSLGAPLDREREGFVHGFCTDVLTLKRLCLVMPSA